MLKFMLKFAQLDKIYLSRINVSASCSFFEHPGCGVCPRSVGNSSKNPLHVCPCCPLLTGSVKSNIRQHSPWMHRFEQLKNEIWGISTSGTATPPHRSPHGEGSPEKCVPYVDKTVRFSFFLTFTLLEN